MRNDLRCNCCNRIWRVGVFGGLCICGCGSGWESTLTLWERLMFATGLWQRYDYTDTLGVRAPLGGERNAHNKALDAITEK